MPFPTDTILVRKRAKKDHPFNRIKVVGVSPIRGARATGEWVGESGDDIIVEGLSAFAAPTTFPSTVLERDYDVESMPEVFEQVIDPRRRPRVSQLSPEESLRRQAAEIEAGKAEESTREKTAITADA